MRGVFREIEAFSNISIFFEDIFKEIEAFFKLIRGIKIAELFKYIFIGIEVFLK
jgi:hypothetical protein